MKKEDLQFASQLTELFMMSMDGTISEDQFSTMMTLLKTSSQARRYYYDFIVLHVGINEMGILSEIAGSQQEGPGQDIWKELLEYEKAAPAIDLRKEEPIECEEQNLLLKQDRQKIKKFARLTLLCSAAAILLIIIFVKFVPERLTSIGVATLVDQTDVKWAQADFKMATGSRLWTDELPMHLDKGIVKIRYDNGVDVLVEGPAVFKIRRSDLFLEYGRLYSCVPESGVGFTVKTPASDFVDLGTEFGVKTDNVSSELYVMKGKVQLFAGLNGTTKTDQIITQNQAVSYNLNRERLEEISIEKGDFVRQLDSKNNLVWRGQMRVNLADIVGAGNGFGTGHADQGILLDTGMFTNHPILASGHGGKRSLPANVYNKVSQASFIDGVFVPDGGEGDVVVSSQGHLFKECPDTNAHWSTPILNGARTSQFSEDRLMFEEQTYGTPDNPALFMHANAGITFNVQSLCRSLSDDVLPEHFTTQVIAVKNVYDYMESRFDVWILVDGQVRFSKTMMGLGESIPVDIALNPEDHFLTVVVTDGIQDLNTARIPKNHCDWCLLGRPELILKMK